MMEDRRKRIGSIDYSDSVLLVSSSLELAGALRDVINGTRASVEDLPSHTAVKAVVLDSEIAKQGWWFDVACHCFVALLSNTCEML
jgi:hypothetical protein